MKSTVLLLSSLIIAAPSIAEHVYEDNPVKVNLFEDNFLENGGFDAEGPGRLPRNMRYQHTDALVDTLTQMPNTGSFFGLFRDLYPLPDGLQDALPEYDYIIVGAGSAGSVLAARLSRDKHTSVLLLEAGKPEVSLSRVPIVAQFFQLTSYSWPYRMERQAGVCLGMIDQRCFWPRGRAVGGTSVINYMIYTRGRPQDWDRIAADGNYGWSYEDVLPYFMKSENANLKRYNSSYHGHGGELNVEDVSFRSKLSSAFLASGRLLGHPTVDYNHPDGFGFGLVQSTTKNGRRQSTAKAFLEPNKKRKNLHILPESRVLKVIIDPETKVAQSIVYFRRGKLHTVRARKEIILSAGPLASPQLLMLSGIGPKRHLRKFGIPVIKDLQVGQTLYDHITFPGLVFLLNTSSISITQNNLLSNIGYYITQWIQDGQGPLTILGGVEGIGYIKTSASRDPEPVPDIELIDVIGSMVTDNGETLRRGMMITDEVYNGGFGSINGRETWTMFPMLTHPKSKGHMELRSADPFQYPKFYGNYLTDPQDLASLIAAIKYIIKISKTQPFQKYGLTLHKDPLPTCVHLPFGTDEYWECAIRTLTATLHHQIGTCKMGPVSDPEAIVDPELRVYGIKNLRVADSGVIPRTISAHTNAPAIMIGEKAADLIMRSRPSTAFR